MKIGAKQLLNYLLLVGFEVWIWWQAVQLVSDIGEAQYSTGELLWFYFALACAPIPVVLLLYRSRRTLIQVLLVGALPAVFFGLILTDFVTAPLTVSTLALVFFYGSVQATVFYLVQKNSSNLQLEIFYIGFKLLSLGAGFVLVGLATEVMSVWYPMGIGEQNALINSEWMLVVGVPIYVLVATVVMLRPPDLAYWSHKTRR